MISYGYESLFLQDSIDKQLNITYSGGSITNSQIDGQNFELGEMLNSGSELDIGQCNSSSIKFKVGYYEDSIEGKELTTKITPYGGSAFQIGKYTVISDKPTADRKRKEVIAYDKLYFVLPLDVTNWYHTILPDNNSSCTLKQFRDSFFSYIGITQASTNLPNDSMTVRKRTDIKTFTGKQVLYAICQCNGRFGRIGRNGNFQYVGLPKPKTGLYPSTTLYPSNSLYPRDYGYSDNPIFPGGTYIKCKYEDYKAQAIDKLIIRTAEDDIGVTIGTGNNPYIIQNNFLLFGKNSTELTTIGNNIYNAISGVWYIPSTIEAQGDPCLECGDGVRLRTVDGKDIDTIILKRKLKGIQALTDVYTAEGTKERENNPNSTQAQINQTQGNVRQVKADLIEAQTIIAGEIQADRARIGAIETDYLKSTDISTFSLDASQITTGTLDADRINANSISVNKLNVNTLMANTILNSTDNDSTEIKLHDLYFRGYYLSLQPVTIGNRTYLMLGFDTTPTP